MRTLVQYGSWTADHRPPTTGHSFLADDRPPTTDHSFFAGRGRASSAGSRWTWRSAARAVVSAIAVGAALMAGASPAAAAEDNGGFVTPGQPLRDLRAREDGSPPSPSGARLPEWWSSDAARLGGLISATAAALAALYLLHRRRRLRAGAGSGGMRLEILDRIALSTRQWVCILRVDEKRVVVGVSGDTMTPLAVLDDAHQGARLGSGGGSVEGGQGLEVEGHRREDERGSWGAGPGRGVSSREPLRRDEGTFWFRPGSGAPEGGAPAGSGGDVPWENHLAPYRREVNRLRAMLQSWNRTTEREEEGQKNGGEDQSK